MHEHTREWYKRQYNIFEQARALNDEDLKLYATIIHAQNPSETQMNDLTALTRQGKQYVVTGEVTYFVDGNLISEEKLLERVRTALSNGFERSTRETLIDMLRLSERQTLRRTDIQRIERIFEREEEELARRKKTKV